MASILLSTCIFCVLLWQLFCEEARLGLLDGLGASVIAAGSLRAVVAILIGGNRTVRGGQIVCVHAEHCLLGESLIYCLVKII